MLEGEPLGLLEGPLDGESLGNELRLPPRLLEGDPLGLLYGDTVGTTDGFPSSSPVVARLGLSEGSLDGESLGNEVGLPLGLLTGDPLGLLYGDTVGFAVGKSVGKLVGDVVVGDVDGDWVSSSSSTVSLHTLHVTGQDSLINFPFHTILQRFSSATGSLLALATHLHFFEFLYRNEGSSKHSSVGGKVGCEVGA